jgi:tRNA(Arg) A34 adenosine deaminase TadA
MHLRCNPFRMRIEKAFVRPYSMDRILGNYNTYNWKPDSLISMDDNYMDLTLLVTRSSKLKHGSMACILVQDVGDNVPMELTLTYFIDRIISASTNKALYNENQSDIHAEIAAIGLAARDGRETLNCTAYITMPPCRKCFAALLCAGVRRIVSRHESPLLDLATIHDIEMVTLSDWDGSRDRIQAIVNRYEEQIATECTNENAV